MPGEDFFAEILQYNLCFPKTKLYDVRFECCANVYRKKINQKSYYLYLTPLYQRHSINSNNQVSSWREGRKCYCWSHFLSDNIIKQHFYTTLDVASKYFCKQKLKFIYSSKNERITREQLAINLKYNFIL